MTVKQCDLCKSYFEFVTHDYADFLLPVKEVDSSRTDYRGAKEFSILSYDICPECYNRMAIFIKTVLLKGV